ncbi:MAG TPA: hypothetical protein VFD36_24040 [Kofleriaceae bacterium]|nr:hypothetical protein [Kofleriaceae bacterium]
MPAGRVRNAARQLAAVASAPTATMVNAPLRHAIACSGPSWRSERSGAMPRACWTRYVTSSSPTRTRISAAARLRTSTRRAPITTGLAVVPSPGSGTSLPTTPISHARSSAGFGAARSHVGLASTWCSSAAVTSTLLRAGNAT